MMNLPNCYLEKSYMTKSNEKDDGERVLKNFKGNITPPMILSIILKSKNNHFMSNCF